MSKNFSIDQYKQLKEMEESLAESGSMELPLVNVIDTNTSHLSISIANAKHKKTHSELTGALANRRNQDSELTERNGA